MTETRDTAILLLGAGYRYGRFEYAATMSILLDSMHAESTLTIQRVHSCIDSMVLAEGRGYGTVGAVGMV